MIKAEHCQLLHTWAAMIYRCHNPDAPKYHNYGGRGIFVCERWHDFRLFAEDMHPRPKGKSLDRIDNNGNYSPDNCRWATAQEQASNQRRTVNLTINGKTQNVMAWARQEGRNRATILYRLRNGWSPEEAVYGRRFAKRYPGVEFHGESLPIKQWAERTGIPRDVISRRLKSGWDIGRALTTPNKQKKRRKIEHPVAI